MPDQEQVFDEYLDHLFVYKFDRIAELDQIHPRTNMVRLDIAAYLRSLVHDGLSGWIEERYDTPLLVLRPEPVSGNPRCDQNIDVPENVRSAAVQITAESHPPGFFHAVYTLQEFLELPVGVLNRRPITARDCILFLSNHLGGVHARKLLVDGDGRRNIKPAELLRINRSFLLFDTPGVYQFFDVALMYIFRCIVPLRNEVVEKMNNLNQN